MDEKEAARAAVAGYKAIQQHKAKMGCIGCLGILGVVAVIILVASLGEKQSPETPKRAVKHSSPKNAASEERTAREDAAKCRRSLQCTGDKLVVAAGAYCPNQIEKLAQYDYRWTDGVLEPKFSRFRWGEKGHSIVMVGDKLQLQNGFGAWRNYIYECLMDVASERPLSVNAFPGRLP